MPFTTSTLVSSFFPALFFPAKLGALFSAIILISFALKFFPNTTVQFKYAFISAVAIVLSLEISKYFFTTYTAKSLIYNALYGGFAVLPLFLLWLYINWVIFLSGTQLSYILQNHKYLHKLGNHNQWDVSPVLDKERVLLIFKITQLLCKHDLKRRDLLNSIEMPEFTVDTALVWLQEKKWLQQRSRKFHTIYFLTKSTKKMKVSELWDGIISIDKSDLTKNKLWERNFKHARINS